MKKLLSIYLAVRVLAVASVVPLLPMLASQAVAEPCQPCLAKALQTEADKNYNVIKDTWEAYRRTTAAMKKVEAVGTPEQIATMHALQKKAADAWRKAEAMAQAIADPSFAGYLDKRKTTLEASMADTLARQKKILALETQLLKSTFGPERRGLVADIAGYQKEGIHLRNMFIGDALLLGFSVNEEAQLGASKYLRDKFIAQIGNDPLKQAASLMISSTRFYDAQLKASTTGISMLVEGKILEDARRENDQVEAFATGVKMAGEGALRFAKLVAESPNSVKLVGNVGKGAAEHSALVLNLLAVTLDTVLVSAAVNRLNEANGRLDGLEASESRVRDRIKVATDQVVRERQRLELNTREIAYQKRVAALYDEIRKAPP